VGKRRKLEYPCRTLRSIILNFGANGDPWVNNNFYKGRYGRNMMFPHLVRPMSGLGCDVGIRTFGDRIAIAPVWVNIVSISETMARFQRG
jgi:hypothetical protein